MRVAWFRPGPSACPPSVDDTSSLLAELAAAHQVELFTEPRAHEFVWRQARRPFDVSVYELADTPAAGFIWPYLLHYPGIVRLRSASFDRSRAHRLERERRLDDYAREAALGTLRIPLLASRLVVVADAGLADTLQDAHAEARIRHAPLGVHGAERARLPAGRPPVVGVTDSTQRESVARAAARARDAGSCFELRLDVTAGDAVRECDIVVTLRWPPAPEPPMAALLAMSAARPVVVYEAATTAAWPALDPQTWQPRGIVPEDDPIAVSIDPRDEEHSLMLALRRLAGDAALRSRLGTAAHAWWRANATPAVAAAAWQRLLEEAASCQPPAKPPDWPAHLTADGSERTRALLADLGVTVDFLDSPPRATIAPPASESKHA